MALVINSKVGETSTTTGTVAYTLAGAISASWATFADVGDANTTYYLAEEAGVGWELGLGTYTAAGTTLARTTVLKSSNADAAVSWAAGTRNIYLVTPDFIVQRLFNSGLGGDGTNTKSGANSTMIGGRSNTVSAADSTVCGGQSNSATSSHATVVGGLTNIASGGQSCIGGGQNNTASGPRATIAGGKSNTATGANESFIGGGLSNTVSATRAAASIVGGESNTADADHSVVAGGKSSTITGAHGFVGAGETNSVTGTHASVVGGNANTATGTHSVVSGGDTNVATGTHSNVAGGASNTALADHSNISGGRDATTRGIRACEARASGKFATQGDAQVSRFVMMKETTDGVSGHMASENAVGSINNRPVIPIGYGFYLTGRILGWDVTNSDRAAYDIEMVGYRDSGGNMVLTYSNVTTISADDLVAWGGPILSVNDTNKVVEVKVQGAAATTIHWVGNFELIEAG